MPKWPSGKDYVILPARQSLSGPNDCEVHFVRGYDLKSQEFIIRLVTPMGNDTHHDFHVFESEFGEALQRFGYVHIDRVREALNMAAIKLKGD